MKANVRTIHPIRSSPAARNSTGSEYFHVCTFSLISERRSWRRVAMNSFNSSFVSVKTAPSDFSLFTVNPPDAQSYPKQKSQRAGGQDHMHRILAHDLIGAETRAVIASLDLGTQF